MFTFSISKELVITNQRLKTYVVRRSVSEGWQGNHNKILEGRKNCECSVSTEIRETNIVFSN